MTRSARCRESGLSLIELIIALALSGLLAAAIAGGIARPLQALLESGERGGWSVQGARVLEVLAAELESALPHSIRIGCGGQCLEFLRVLDYGEYRGDTPGDPLDFAATDSSFDVVPPLASAPTPGTFVFVNAASADTVAPQGAYASGAASPRGTIVAGASAGTLQFAPKQFPSPSPTQRFYLVDGAVSYLCSPQAVGGTLRRRDGYGILAAQPGNPALGALLADDVIDCRFRLLAPDMLAVELRFGRGTLPPISVFAQFGPRLRQ